MQLTTSPSQHTTVPLCRTFPACNTYAVSLVDRGVRIKRLGRDSFGCVQRLVRARARSLVVRSMPAGILRRSGYRHRPVLQRGCTSAMRSRAIGKRALSQSSQASVSAGTVAAATSAPGLGPLVPHLCRDWGHSCHICAGTGATRATSAPGLGPSPSWHRFCSAVHFGGHSFLAELPALVRTASHWSLCRPSVALSAHSSVL
jgi:hypothetical protein